MLVIPAAGPLANQVPDAFVSPGVVSSGPQSDNPMSAARKKAAAARARRDRVLELEIMRTMCGVDAYG